MRCYEENQSVLDEVWRRIQRRWRTYPTSMRSLAHEMLETLGPKPNAFFSAPDSSPLLHFPIWLADRALRASLPIVLEATALAYFYVRIQDNILDEPATRGKPPLLLLSNLLLADSMALFADFAQSPIFWQRARAAWTLFSEETECERRQLSTIGNYSNAAFRRHSRKVALARIPLYAVLARMGRTDRATLNRVDRLIDCMGQAYGLVNDVLGCSRDLSSGANTYLLSAASATLPRSKRRDPRSVERALLVHPFFEQFLQRAARLHRRALPLGEELGLRAMRAFTEERIVRIEHHTRQMRALRLTAALARTVLPK